MFTWRSHASPCDDLRRSTNSYSAAACPLWAGSAVPGKILMRGASTTRPPSRQGEAALSQRRKSKSAVTSDSIVSSDRVVCDLACGPFVPKGKLLRCLSEITVFIANAHAADRRNVGDFAGRICRRFVGGSARNSASWSNPGQPVHGMQIVQSRINTGDCASR